MRFLKTNLLTSQRPTAVLSLAPLVDILSVLLIFMILTFFADEKSVQRAQGVNLPEVPAELKALPKIHLELLPENKLRLNQKSIARKSLVTEVKKMSGKPEPVLIIGDRRLNFGRIDSLISDLTRAGYTDFQFLTEYEKKGEVK